MDLDRTDKFCLFYKDEVPDLGPEFVYVKLGRRGKFRNPLQRTVIAEERFRNNLAAANPWLWNFTALYLLQANGLVHNDNVMVIHYDVVLDPDWREKISAFRGKLGVLGDLTVREWMGDDKPVTVLMLQEIDEVFRQVRGESFWGSLREHRIERVAGWSQFVARRDVWERMAAFVLPFVEHLKDRRPALMYHPHLVELCWGTFCALEQYEVVSFLRDGPPSTHLYGPPLAFDREKFCRFYERILNGEMTVQEAYRQAGVDMKSLDSFRREPKEFGGFLRRWLHLGL